ncbi:MAG: uroporphyrinogen-III synthase [Pseudomonadota bacterium]
MVTRPQPFAAGTAALLRGRGYRPLVVPLLRKAARDAAVPFEPDAVTVTSRAGAAELARFPELCRRRLFAVGEATAEAARGVGADVIAVGTGGVDALAELIVSHAPNSVLHLSGEDQAGDLVGTLRSAGISAERLVVYAMEPVGELPDVSGSLLAVLLYSPRTARLFDERARTAPWRAAPVIAMSAEVAAALPGRDVAVAARPDEASLLIALDAFAAGGAPT